MLVLGLDLETSGLDRDTCDILEFGAVLWNVKDKRPVHICSVLNRDFKSEVPLEIESLIGLKAAEVRRFGKTLRECLDQMTELMEAADYIVAHNGTGFDKPFLNQTFKSAGLEMPERTWIDTQIDLPFPDKMGTRKLSYLACEHGFVNPFPHRAVTDVLTTLKIFAQYDFETVVAIAETPIVQVIAQVGYEERHKPRQAGFRWDSEKKFWYLDIRKALIQTREFNFRHYINDNSMPA